LAAGKLGVAAEDMLVASTGVIGVRLPMERIQMGVAKISLKQNGGYELARAIMTTDTFPKEVALRVQGESGVFTIGGVAKGAGMIHPQLATMLCFLATDADIEAGLLQRYLRQAIEVSFNMVTIDGDTSPNDMVVVLANGASGSKVREDSAGPFCKALEEVCVYLAKNIARDGEGATKLIEVVVEGAIGRDEARLAARTIAASPLVKAAVHGNDPNWGRIVAALGRSGIRLDEKRLDVYLCNTCVMAGGKPQLFDRRKLSMDLDSDEVSIRVHLNLGSARAVAWGCDLSEEYVTINSAYTS
jgi:glutamate N-acetyltransferase/amino-acid N-acetyltransferase